MLINKFTEMAIYVLNNLQIKSHTLNFKKSFNLKLQRIKERMLRGEWKILVIHLSK